MLSTPAATASFATKKWLRDRPLELQCYSSPQWSPVKRNVIHVWPTVRQSLYTLSGTQVSGVQVHGFLIRCGRILGLAFLLQCHRKEMLSSKRVRPQFDGVSEFASASCNSPFCRRPDFRKYRSRHFDRARRGRKFATFFDFRCCFLLLAVSCQSQAQ